jgi:hypothetical protein
MDRHVPIVRVLRLGCLVLACVAGLAATAHAQASITGVVRDTSGAVLPGVTVEASSPALIEKVRVAVSDGSGQYRIENLRPGPYTVTFTLGGFSSLRREGIQLTGTAVATVHAEMVVGALEETVTVTGEAPTVDVQNTIRQRVLDREVLEVLPSGRGASRLAALAPSVTPDNHDVGGVMGDGSTRGGITSRGVSDSRLLMAGVSVQTGTGTTHGLYNLEAYEEILVDTGAVNADYYTGGVRINFIPRDGGNTFSGSFQGSFANESMSSDNLSDEARDQGLTSNKVKQLAEVNPSFGGPISRDRLWFHTAALYSRAWNFAPVFFNKHAGNPAV